LYSIGLITFDRTYDAQANPSKMDQASRIIPEIVRMSAWLAAQPQAASARVAALGAASAARAASLAQGVFRSAPAMARSAG
jgi:hypothetical protein